MLGGCRGLGPHGRPHKHSMLPAESFIDERDTCSRKEKMSLQPFDTQTFGRHCRLTNGKKAEQHPPYSAHGVFPELQRHHRGPQPKETDKALLG